MPYRFFIACIFLFAVLAANAAELFVNGSPRPFALADKLESDATIGGYPIWAGEGKWRLFELSVRDSTGRSDPVLLGTANLFQTEGKNLVAIMSVDANLTGRSGYWNEEPCKREDMLFKQQLSGGRQDNCVTINHIASYFNNPTGKWGELYALLKTQGIEVPPTVLRIDLTRNGTGLRRLVYTIWVNPEILGFARETETGWGKNSWHKTFSSTDPAKKQFIEALSAWALNFAKRMDDGLDQKSDAFKNIPSWRAVLEGAPKLEASKAPVKLD